MHRSNLWKQIKVLYLRKNHRTGTGLQYAKLGLMSSIIVQFHEIPTYRLRVIVFTRNVHRANSKFSNSAKNRWTETELQYAKVGLISSILVKFHDIPINGFREILVGYPDPPYFCRFSTIFFNTCESNFTKLTYLFFGNITHHYHVRKLYIF